MRRFADTFFCLRRGAEDEHSYRFGIKDGAVLPEGFAVGDTVRLRYRVKGGFREDVLTLQPKTFSGTAIEMSDGTQIAEADLLACYHLPGYSPRIGLTDA